MTSPSPSPGTLITTAAELDAVPDGAILLKPNEPASVSIIWPTTGARVSIAERLPMLLVYYPGCSYVTPADVRTRVADALMAAATGVLRAAGDTAMRLSTSELPSTHLGTLGEVRGLNLAADALVAAADRIINA